MARHRVPARVTASARVLAHDPEDMSSRTCPARHLRRAGPLLLALGVAALASCTSHGEGGLPPRPLRQRSIDGTPSPMSLTASDGTGLKLISLKARAVVEEPLAFTELHLVFENPTDRTIEGRFEINMPPHAAISRYAMKINGQWQEGEVVERRAAQVAFEDALHRKQDPALLENKAGNAFSARVFPIFARERKELIVSYSQELTSSAEPYRLMLRGLPELAELDASVVLKETAPASAGASTSLATSAAQTRVIELKRQGWTPDQDLEVRSGVVSQVVGLRHENLAVARIAPTGAMPPAPIGGLTVLFDTSASRALDFDRQLVDLVGLLEGLRAQTGEDFALRVVCFDQTTAEVYAGPASGFGTAQVERISTRRALGASDLRQALAAVATGPVSPRLLILSDGVATAGATELAQLEAAARALADVGVQRIDAIVDGGIQDAGTLKAVATAALPHKGVVADGRLPLTTLAHKLASATLPTMDVHVPGAAWVWPEQVEGAQPGDELLVYADLPAGAAMKVVLTGDTLIETDIPGTLVERPLLERAWVGARIDRLNRTRSRLEADDRDARGALKQQIIAISTKYRVLSDFTAMLVLETDWDYSRFNIDRTALTDILAVGPTGVTLQNRRTAPPLLLVPTPPAPTPSDSNGRHKGEEGRMGPPTRDFDLETGTQKAGLYATTQPDAGHSLASPYGGAYAVGTDDADVWGGLVGTEIGEAYGVGGLGLVGTGRGGGGTGEGTIGLGNTGLVGTGGGRGFAGRDGAVMVRQGKAEVQGGLDTNLVRRIVRAHVNEVRYCYNQALARDPESKGRVTVQFTVGGTGKVPSAVVQETTMKDPSVGNCVAQAVKRWTFPKPTDGMSAIISYPFIFETDGNRVASQAPPRPVTAKEQAALSEQMRRDAEAATRAERDRVTAAAEEAVHEAERRRVRDAEEAVFAARRAVDEKIHEAEREAEAAELQRSEGSPYLGKMYDVMSFLKRGNVDEGLALALRWREDSPGDVLALIALGEALEAAGDEAGAARAYGSIIDLFPARADLRRYVGGRFEQLGQLDLAIDTFARAVEQRPDHPASHRLYAFALAKAGRHADAFAAVSAGLEQHYPDERFLGAARIMREDAALLLSAWLAADPTHATEIRRAGDKIGVTPDGAPSLRFVLTWETDANDVDFHIIDNTDERAYFSHKRLESGGELFADVTTGYGPECFAIPGEASAFPYNFVAQYYSRGPMGYGMGKLQIVQHDGDGGLKFDDRPFIIMKDSAFVELGKLDRPL